jgi:CHAD domain-containing protein
MELLSDRVGTLEGPDRDAGARLLERMADERRTARDHLMDAIREPRYAEILDRLVSAGNDPALMLEADLPAGATLPDLLRKPWRKLRQAVKRLDDPPADEDLHAVRIRAKRLRYAAEAVSPLLGKSARDLGEAAADLQDVLGRHNDAVVAARWLREAAARARSARTAFVAGELAGLERWEAAQTRDTWRAAWKRVKAKRRKALG